MKSGEFTSGVRDGMDDATHDALNKCMQHVDEVNEYAAKIKGESAEYEASKQEWAGKVLVGSIRRAVSRVYIIRAKRVSNCYIPPKKSARLIFFVRVHD